MGSQADWYKPINQTEKFHSIAFVVDDEQYSINNFPCFETYITCHLFALSAKSSCCKRRSATKYNTVDTSTEFNEHSDDTNDEQPLQEL